MEFEIEDRPQAPDFCPRPVPADPRRSQAQRPVKPRHAPDWRDQAVLIPDQEYGS